MASKTFRIELVDVFGEMHIVMHRLWFDHRGLVFGDIFLGEVSPGPAP